MRTKVNVNHMQFEFKRSDCRSLKNYRFIITDVLLQNCIDKIFCVHARLLTLSFSGEFLWVLLLRKMFLYFKLAGASGAPVLLAL